MKLPLKYIETMKTLLGAEYDAYLASFDEERFYGLRVNTLKISAEEMAAKGVFSLRSVPWCETGFYYDGAERPAKHPYYHAGLYYLQEPSAMSPAATLPIGEGDRVLDLCAAPGGKTTQLGARLGGTGLLVANDISAGRAKTLLKNVELAGIRNAIVMSETPERIAERLPNFFDEILVDVPCSGEGMFRKEPDMVKSWDADMLAFCRSEQAKILEACAPMLKTGGMLLYSTCTFSQEEKEKSIGDVLERHKEFELMPIGKKYVDLRGGTIDVKSEFGKGSTFTVTLKHRIADEGYYTEKHVEELETDSGILEGRNILLAEDNDLNAEIAEAILERAGLKIERVEDGIQCVNQIMEMPAGTYDMILMDIQMPKMDGYKATQTIRNLSDQEKTCIPIIAMTANAFEEDKRAAIAAGMNGHIAKPIQVDKLLSILAEMIRQQEN